jgi:PKHD-type hydroxylase
MQLTNYYWYFDNVLPKFFCNQLIKYGNSLREKQALTAGVKYKDIENKEALNDLKKIRDSNIAWISGSWLYDELLRYVNIANYNSGWNYHWDWAEDCQFTKYKLNQYYHWHRDGWDKPYGEDKGNLKGKSRKLSMIVQLSDPKDYKGGEVEFNFGDNGPDEKSTQVIADEIKPQGSIAVFPSFVWHRVKPVTSGTRYSLVLWCCGRPFQ